MSAREKSKKLKEPTAEALAAEADLNIAIEKKTQGRIDAARVFAIKAAKTAKEMHCANVIVLDVSAISPIADFFIIATGTSPRQMRSVCDDLKELGDEHNFSPRSKPNVGGDQWLLVDFVDVVVHLFTDEARHFYDLENLWGEAKTVDWTK